MTLLLSICPFYSPKQVTYKKSSFVPQNWDKQCSPKIQVHLEPQNVTLFRNRVFAGGVSN